MKNRTKLISGFFGFLWVSILFAIPLIANGATSEQTAFRAATIFRETEKIVAELESHQYAETAKSEITILKNWLKEGIRQLKKHKIRRAAVIAERLPGQVELVRKMLALASLEQEYRNVGESIAELERNIRVLQKKHERLLMDRSGTSLTGAYPAKEDSK